MPTPCRRWRRSTRSSRRCCGTGRRRSCAAPTPTRCRRSSMTTAACTRRSTSSPPRRAGSPASRRTSRTFLFAPRSVAAPARVHRRAGAPCSPPITRRSSSHPRARRTGLFEASSAAPTCTPRLRPRLPRRRARSTVRQRFAKVVNYGLAYGMEAYGLGQRLDIPTDQAREILDAYFAAFPNVAGYMTETVREAKARGVHHDDLRSAPPAPRAVVRQLPHPADGRAHRPGARPGAGFGS